MTTTEQPQSEKPQTALDLWNAQVQGLADLTQAELAIGFIYDQLMGLHEKLMSNGNEKAAVKVADAYNHARELYNTTMQQGLVITGGAAAIQEANEQREQTLIELQQLLKAIDEGDENHPKLSGWAEGIREDADAYAEDAYYENLNEGLVESIMQEWGLDFEEADAVLDGIMGNSTLTDKQKELFRAFAQSLIEDDEDPDADDEDGDE